MRILCACVFSVIEGVQQRNILPVATLALRRERPNLFCVYVRVGVEKETQTQVFWELIFRERISNPYVAH